MQYSEVRKYFFENNLLKLVAKKINKFHLRLTISRWGLPLITIIRQQNET